MFKKYFVLIFIIAFSCKNKEINKTTSKNEVLKIDTLKQIKTTETVIQDTIKNIEKEEDDWRHPDFFEFKNYKEYKLTDTIKIDLNGNGINEKIYFAYQDCNKLLIEEKGQKTITLGCRDNEYPDFPNAVGWVNLWCVVNDKETFEIIVENGDLVGERKFKLERPSLYIGKEEAGGGIITYKNGKLYWVHQSD